MMTNKTFGLLLIILISCTVQKLPETNLLSAQWNNWFGGVQGVSGTTYKIQFVSSTSIQVDSVRIGMDIHTDLQKRIQQDTTFIVIKTNVARNSKLKSDSTIEGVLYYNFDNEVRSLIISDFERTSDLYMR